MSLLYEAHIQKEASLQCFALVAYVYLLICSNQMCLLLNDAHLKAFLFAEFRSSILCMHDNNRLYTYYCIRSRLGPCLLAIKIKARSIRAARDGREHAANTCTLAPHAHVRHNTQGLTSPTLPTFLLSLRSAPGSGKEEWRSVN